MARLTTKKRKSLPRSSFAVPSKRGYPIHDKSHARNALARVEQFGTEAEKATVKAKVRARYPDIEVDGKKKGKKKKKRKGG